MQRPGVSLVRERAEGPRLALGAQAVQSVASLDGVRARWGGGAGAWLRLRPQTVLVHAPDGSVSQLMLIDASGAAQRGVATVALAVFVVCWLIRRLAARANVSD